MNAISASREVVLVVDDSPSTLGLLNEALEVAGYTVLVAESGDAALELVQRISPDIVLLDAVMPGLDGFETCRRMKQGAVAQAIPVVFMTGLTETEHVIRGLEAGGVDYVAKPVTPDEVVARVTVHLATARLTRSARAALDTTGRFLLAVGQDGAVRWSTPQADRLLSHAANGPVNELPATALAWLQSSLDRRGPPADFTVAFGAEAGCSLRLAFLGQVGPNEILLRLAPSYSDEAVLSNQLGLTSRESEVLLWLSRGKSNRDIATILGLSPRTVNKHLEQVFDKLQVENRASATAIAIRALQATA